MTRELRCTSGHVVGVTLGPEHAGLVAVQHQGREIIAYGIVVIRCGCGACWRPNAPGRPLDNLEVKAPQMAGRR